MAALSYYSNWGTSFDYSNSDISAIFEEQIPPPQLYLDCMNNDNNSFGLPEENPFDPNDLFLFDEYCNSFPSSVSPENNNFNQMQTYQTQPFSFNQDFEQFHYPKRQKPEFCNQQVIYSDALFSPVPSPCLNFQDFSPMSTVTSHLPDFATGPPVFNIGSCEQTVKNSPKQQTNGGNLSSQSIAARQRRRRITEKTRELGKLIPGAQRMNTAEMFQAAYKHIKCLQAQVGILEFMGSYEQEKGMTFKNGELESLVESPLVQEKLYSSEKCIVPKKFVQELSKDGQVFQSKPHVLKEIKELVPKREC